MTNHVDSIPKQKVYRLSEYNYHHHIFLQTQGAVSSAAEVIAMSFFVFAVLCYLTPYLAIFTLQPVFIFQFLGDIVCDKIPYFCNCKHYNQAMGSCLERWYFKIRKFFRFLLKNKSMRFLASLLQFLGMVGFTVFIWIVKKQFISVIALPLSIATFSIVWSNKVQVYLASPKSQNIPMNKEPKHNARYKASKLYCLACFTLLYIM